MGPGGRAITYTVALVKERDGRYSVSVPAFDGRFTWGHSVPCALEMAQQAVELYLEVLEEDGKPIPPDKPNPRVNMRYSTEPLLYRLPVREAAVA